MLKEFSFDNKHLKKAGAYNDYKPSKNDVIKNRKWLTD